MAKSMMGARVRYCGHKGVFPADIFVVGNVNVVKANGPVTGVVPQKQVTELKS